jgi:hypothetical protein
MRIKIKQTQIIASNLFHKIKQNHLRSLAITVIKIAKKKHLNR